MWPAPETSSKRERPPGDDAIVDAFRAPRRHECIGVTVKK
jgi:hypothetical protein